MNRSKLDYFELLAKQLNIDLNVRWSDEQCQLILQHSSKEEIKLEFERIFTDGNNNYNTKEWIRSVEMAHLQNLIFEE